LRRVLLQKLTIFSKLHFAYYLCIVKNTKLGYCVICFTCNNCKNLLIEPSLKASNAQFWSTSDSILNIFASSHWSQTFEYTELRKKLLRNGSRN
jgi:hypothetical protein